MSTTFKTCLFGGFDRDDVVSYIEKTALENRERIQQLTENSQALKNENEAMRRELESLRAGAADAQGLAEKYEALCRELEELKQRSQTLESENTELRSQAREYQSLKDHIAEIEISAHRRTQEFRAAAIEQLHGLVAQQRDWFGKRRGQVAELHEGVRSRLQAAQEALSEMDLSEFDRLDQDLQDLDNRLDGDE